MLQVTKYQELMPDPFDKALAEASGDSFNGTAHLIARKDYDQTGLMKSNGMLQWDRAFDSAEGPAPSYGNQSRRDASMGPRI